MKVADEIGLEYEVLTPEEVREKEPLFTKDIKFVLRSNDTGFDPFRLCIAQAYDAKVRGAEIRTHHEVVGVLMEDNRVKGVRVLDRINNRLYEIRAKVVINAAGPWSAEITRMAGFDIPMKPNRVVQRSIACARRNDVLHVAISHRWRWTCKSRFQNTALLGTSSVDVEDPDDNEPGLDEIELMETSMAEMIQGILDARSIRMCVCRC